MVQTTQLYISHYLNLLHLISLSPGHPSSDHPKKFFDSGSPSAANNISVFLMQHGVLPRTALTSFITSCSDVIRCPLKLTLFAFERSMEATNSLIFMKFAEKQQNAPPLNDLK